MPFGLHGISLHFRRKIFPVFLAAVVSPLSQQVPVSAFCRTERKFWQHWVIIVFGLWREIGQFWTVLGWIKIKSATYEISFLGLCHQTALWNARELQGNWILGRAEHAIQFRYIDFCDYRSVLVFFFSPEEIMELYHLSRVFILKLIFCCSIGGEREKLLSTTEFSCLSG